jgi:predicted double-glycine peptidase
MIETMVTYSNNNNPHDLVLIKSDDSFVILGDSEISDSDLIKMTEWEDVQGWIAQ